MFSSNCKNCQSSLGNRSVVNNDDPSVQNEYQRSLMESEERIRTIYENIPGGLLIIDKNYIIRDVNKVTCRITGYEREELIGQLCDIVCPKGSESKLCPIWEKGIDNFEGMDTAVKCKNGYKNPIIKNAKKIKLNGEICILENFQDTKELKNVQEKLDVEKERAQLYLDLLGHDIGNLHQGIQNCIQLARESGDKKNLQDELLASGLDLVGSSIHLVSNIGVLSKLRNLEKNFIQIDLNPILVGTVESIKKMYPNKVVKVTYDLSEEMLTIRSEMLVQRIFINIIQNGVKFQEGDTAYIDVQSRLISKENGKVVQISIRDQGPGIPESLKDRIFSKREENIKDHSGIGLSIVKMLVSRYDGNIFVKNRDEERGITGAVFVIEFPYYEDV